MNTPLLIITCVCLILFFNRGHISKFFAEQLKALQEANKEMERINAEYALMYEKALKELLNNQKEDLMKESKLTNEDVDSILNEPETKESVFFEVNAVFKHGDTIRHNLNVPYDELYCETSDPRIGFIPVSISDEIHAPEPDMNAVDLFIPMDAVLSATITIRLKKDVTEWAQSILKSKMEENYRKSLQSAMDYTNRAIHTGELEMKDYFENVTRTLYYNGWMDSIAEMEVDQKQSK